MVAGKAVKNYYGGWSNRNRGQQRNLSASETPKLKGLNLMTVKLGKGTKKNKIHIYFKGESILTHKGLLDVF
jgi:hypothetical protein